jgi:hypothetical protein
MNSPPAAEETGPASNSNPVATAKQSLALPGSGGRIRASIGDVE